MAYDFNDASSQDIDYGDVTLLDGATQISGHIWCNLDDVDADHLLIEKSAVGFNNGFVLFMDLTGPSTDRQFTIFYDSTDDPPVRVAGVTDSAAPAAGWQSVGFSIDLGSATGLRLYIDGSEDANSPTDISGHTTGFPNIVDTLRIGSHTDGSRFMDGQLAEASLWVGRILTAADFASLGSGCSAAFFADGLIFYDRLIRTTFDIVSQTIGTVTGATVSAHPPIFYPTRPSIITTPAAVGGTIIPQMLQQGLYTGGVL